MQNINKGKIEIAISNILVKKAKASGNAAHVIVPKNTIGKNLIVLIPSNQKDTKTFTLYEDINQNIMCNKCKKPLFRPVWDKKKELELCSCKC